MNQLYVFTLIILLLLLVIILYFLNQTSMALILIFAALILAIIGWCHTERGVPWSDKLAMMYRRATDKSGGGGGGVGVGGGMGGASGEGAGGGGVGGGDGGKLGAGTSTSQPFSSPSASALFTPPSFSLPSWMGGGAQEAQGVPPVGSSSSPHSYSSLSDGALYGQAEVPSPASQSFSPTLAADQSVRFTWLPQLPSFNVFGRGT